MYMMLFTETECLLITIFFTTLIHHMMVLCYYLMDPRLYFIGMH